MTKELEEHLEYERKLTIASNLVYDEALRAIDLFPPFNSGHEGKAIIEEELDELWDEVKKIAFGTSREMEKEAVQLGAMVIRFIADVCMPDAYD